MGVCLSITFESVTGFGRRKACSIGKEELLASGGDYCRLREKSDERQTAKGRRSKVGRRRIPFGKRTDFGFERDFANRYALGRLLGHGQFGYTFVAIDKVNGDRVAVKRIDRNKMVLPVAVEDVKREVKILEALRGHENVVHFYNAFEDDKFVYIVMELCQGGELLDRILAKKDNRYSEKDAAIVVRQMLRVAGECHLNGLVHRDMKPENFLFKSTKEDSPLKATDFGLSDFIKPGKKFPDIVGSAYYVAPEVLKRKSGPESDVWSIGVITYILLCGRRPFWDSTEDGIFKEVVPAAKKFQYGGISPELEEKLNTMFSQVVATGDDSWAPSVGSLPPDVGRIQLEDNDVEDIMENNQGGPEEIGGHSTTIGNASTSVSKRRKIGKNKGMTFSLMSDLHQSTLAVKPPPVITVKEVVELISSSTEIRANLDLYYFALDHIRDKTSREIFMSIPEDMRVWWITKAYEKRAH